MNTQRKLHKHMHNEAEATYVEAQNKPLIWI